MLGFWCGVNGRLTKVGTSTGQTAFHGQNGNKFWSTRVEFLFKDLLTFHLLKICQLSKESVIFNLNGIPTTFVWVGHVGRRQAIEGLFKDLCRHTEGNPGILAILGQVGNRATIILTMLVSVTVWSLSRDPNVSSTPNSFSHREHMFQTVCSYLFTLSTEGKPGILLFWGQVNTRRGIFDSKFKVDGNPGSEQDRDEVTILVIPKCPPKAKVS